MELVEIDGPTVYLRLQGACGSCPSSLTTMTMGIRRKLQECIPVSSNSHHSNCRFLGKDLSQSAMSYTIWLERSRAGFCVLEFACLAPCR